MEKIFKTSSSEETISLGYKIGKLLKKNDVVLLVGDLSAGKTTITKGIGQALGIKRVINSPTFTIVKEYSGDEMKLFHLDLYRLDGLNQDFDLEEYFDSDGVCVVEWPYQVSEIIPANYLKIEILLKSINEREVKLISNGQRYDEIIRSLE